MLSHRDDAAAVDAEESLKTEYLLYRGGTWLKTEVPASKINRPRNDADLFTGLSILPPLPPPQIPIYVTVINFPDEKPSGTGREKNVYIYICVRVCVCARMCVCVCMFVCVR